MTAGGGGGGGGGVPRPLPSAAGADGVAAGVDAGVLGEAEGAAPFEPELAHPATPSEPAARSTATNKAPTSSADRAERDDWDIIGLGSISFWMIDALEHLVHPVDLD
jgi:hypothetical protein